jgi:small GTP-binding protein
MIMSFVNNAFPTNYTPTIFDNCTQKTVYKNQPVNLGLWDTAGEENYNLLRPLSYPQTNVFLVCFSIIDRKSFDNVSIKWVPEITQHVKFIFLFYF